MSRTLFIVIGSTGYNDFPDWFVAAYKDRSKAEEHARFAKHRTDEILASWGDRSVTELLLMRSREAGDLALANVWDPNWTYDPPETTYSVSEVPFFDEVPKPSR